MFGSAPYSSSPFGSGIVVTGITFVEGGKGNVIVHTNLGDIIFELSGAVTNIEQFGGALVEQLGLGRFVFDIPSGYITIIDEPATGDIIVDTAEGGIEMQQIGGLVVPETPAAELDIDTKQGDVLYDVPAGTFITTRK